MLQFEMSHKNLDFNQVICRAFYCSLFLLKYNKIKKMKFNRNDLINDLKKDVENAIVTGEKFKQLTANQLNFKAAAERWSILECLEHLNLYGDFYLIEIEKQILKAPISKTTTVFKSGILGNYFAESMQPKPNGEISNKMKTFKDKDPANSNLSITVIDRFLKQQRQLLTLLEQAAAVDLTKVKTNITIKFIRLRLGDTLRFVIYHNNRHLLQANSILK